MPGAMNPLDDLICFVIDAAGTMVALLAAVGFVALCFAIGYILHKEINEMREDEE